MHACVRAYNPRVRTRARAPPTCVRACVYVCMHGVRVARKCVVYVSPDMRPGICVCEYTHMRSIEARRSPNRDGGLEYTEREPPERVEGETT